MRSENFRKLSQKEEEALGLPPGFKLATPYPFGTMNQHDSRMGMKDNEFFYIENFIKLGEGNLRALWDIGTALYNSGSKTIISFFFFNIAKIEYVAVFFSDGTAVQVGASSGAVTTISSVANTFYNGGSLPGCSQWGDQYLIIANNINANAYWIWDGSALYTSGTLSPQVTITSSGSAYSSAPTVTAYGGSGSGATFTASVSNGAIVSVKVTNPGTGYEPGDVVNLLFSGGGSDDGVQLTAAISSQSVQSVVITAAGSGYTPGTYALGFSGGGGGSGAAGTYTVSAGGAVVSTVITSGGSGYNSSPVISFPSGGGSGASGIAIFSAGSVTGIAVTHGGSGITATPNVIISGGGGTGATGVASVTSGGLTSVAVTNGGSGYTSIPTVTIGAGFNHAATASVQVMPFGISGTSIETFQSRVWICSPFQGGTLPTAGIFNVSAPGSYSNFATSAGGLEFDSTDSFLKYQYTNIKQSNGYLYPFGDSSVSVISNVQTSGNPPVTTFNYQNTDPQIGTSWRDSVQAYSLTLLFGNPFGVYGLYGGVVRRISTELDSLFTSGSYPPAAGALTPSSAVANIFSKRVYFLLLTFQDPFTKQNVNKMVGWDEENWLIANQSASLIYIGTQEVNSTMFAWGTDGKNLYPLFNKASASLPKKLSTKLYGSDEEIIQKYTYLVMAQVQDLSSGSSGVVLDVNIEVNAISAGTGTYSYPMPTMIEFAGGSANSPTYPLWVSAAPDVYGMNFGATLNTTSPDFTLNYFALGYKEVAAELALAGG